jgi:hypothetical protein
MQMSVSNSQPQNAPGSISRNFEPGSNVTDSSREKANTMLYGHGWPELPLTPPKKHSRPINSTDAGIQIDFSEMHGLKTPVSSR